MVHPFVLVICNFHILFQITIVMWCFTQLYKSKKNTIFWHVSPYLPSPTSFVVSTAHWSTAISVVSSILDHFPLPIQSTSSKNMNSKIIILFIFYFYFFTRTFNDYYQRINRYRVGRIWYRQYYFRAVASNTPGISAVYSSSIREGIVRSSLSSNVREIEAYYCHMHSYFLGVMMADDCPTLGPTWDRGITDRPIICLVKRNTLSLSQSPRAPSDSPAC